MLISTAAWLNEGIGVIGILSLVVSAVLVAFGARSKLLLSQQAATIDLMEARLTATEGENASLKEKDRAKEIVIEGLQYQITTLTDAVTQKAAVEKLDKEIASRFDDIFKHLNIPIRTGGIK